MIKVTVKSKADGFIDIKADGHASPVICASTSTVLQTCVRFLQELSQQFPDQINVEVEHDG